MSRISNAVLSQSREKFAKAVSGATGAILAGRDGRFSVSNRYYLDVYHWKNKVEIEVVIADCLWRKFKRTSRKPTVRPAEQEAFREFQNRGRDVLLEQLRRTLSEALHAGVRRDTLMNTALNARRRRADA